MERKASSLRFTRGRLAALLLAVVLVTIVVFSLTFYHLCLHAKRMEVLTQGDGPLWAFEQGQLDILSQEADGATVYGGGSCSVHPLFCKLLCAVHGPHPGGGPDHPGRAGPGRDRHSGGARPALLGAGQRLSRCGDMNSRRITEENTAASVLAAVFS